MIHIFEIKGTDRYNEVKDLIRKTMPTARFEHNPFYLNEEVKTYRFSVSYDTEDMGKLDNLLERYYNEDKPIKELSWFEKLKSKIKRLWTQAN